MFVVGGTPDAAQAAEVETVVSSQYLELTSISDPDLLSSMTHLTPVTWQVGVDATPPEPGVVNLGVAASGVMVAPGNLSLGVRRLPGALGRRRLQRTASTWVAPTDLATLVATPTAFGAREIGTMDAAVAAVAAADRHAHERRTRLPGDCGAAAAAGLGCRRAAATGPGALASTGPGSGGWIPPMSLAFGAIGAGLLIATVARRRQEAEDG